MFRLDFHSSFSSPRRGRRKRGADSFPERQLVIEPTSFVDWRPSPVIHLLKIKLVGFKCSDRKHRTIYLQLLFHPLQEKISSLGFKNCIFSCPQSLDKWLPLFSSYLLWSLDLLSFFLNFNRDKVTEIFITFSKSKAWELLTSGYLQR